jgi:hypothetical protein
MTQKEALAQFIGANPRASLEDWIEFQVMHPFIRIKTVGPKNEVHINLEGKSGYLRPRDWLRNYRAEIQVRLEQELDRAINVLPPERIEFVLEKFSIKETRQTQAAIGVMKEFLEIMGEIEDICITPAGLIALSTAANNHGLNFDEKARRSWQLRLYDEKFTD